MTLAAKPAVFLDRDGVLIEDQGPLTRSSDIRVLPGVGLALGLLRTAGYRLIVVSNQTVVARGLLSEQETMTLHREVEHSIVAQGGPSLDGFYFCPHHPSANDAAYRQSCTCRKPEPGLLQRAAIEHGIDLARSVMVGDRPSDIVAGSRAGCMTIWLHTGRHLDPHIETAEPLEAVEPNRVCADLLRAAQWLLEATG